MAAQDYPGRQVVIRFDGARCIHAAECVRGAPQVFDPQADPWIRPDNADPQHLAEVVRRCPSGALTMHYADGRSAEQPDATASATLTADGPVYLRGRIRHGTQEYTRVALCRCGASRNKPFCDGGHAAAGFRDAGGCAAPPAQSDARPGGEATLNPIANGPLMIEGRIEIRTADGSRFVSEEKTWLCRCGASQNKPFCDGTHKKIGFVG